MAIFKCRKKNPDTSEVTVWYGITFKGDELIVALTDLKEMFGEELWCELDPCGRCKLCGKHPFLELNPIEFDKRESVFIFSSKLNSPRQQDVVVRKQLTKAVSREQTHS